MNAKIVRVHVSGDFYSEAYFKAWMEAARLRPDVVFYGYTKSVRYLVKYKADLPSNFRFTASFGGLEDHLIMEHGVKSAMVVYHPDEAEKLGLEIDHDDLLAIKGTKSFALLLHGMQQKGSVASKALSTMRQEKIEFSYS